MTQFSRAILPIVPLILFLLFHSRRALVAMSRQMLAMQARPTCGKDEDEERHPERDTGPGVTDAAAIMAAWPPLQTLDLGNDDPGFAAIKLRQRITRMLTALAQRRPSVGRSFS
jgi:hypothetical protein